MSKYRAQRAPCDVDGQPHLHDSLKERERHWTLWQWAQAGVISDLRCQVRYSLDVNGQHVCDYLADFVYEDLNGNQVVEDTKGMRTREYVLKAKLMLAVHGIRVRET